MGRAALFCTSLVCLLLLALAGATPVRAQVPCEEWGLLARGSGEDSGIGGTGRSGDDSGIGGTGIYGAITAFGSVCVNGIRIHYDDRTRIALNEQLAALDALRIGQVVWVQATSEGGRLRAAEILVLSAVVGAITELDPAVRELRVKEQRVRVPEQAIVVDELGRPLVELSELELGEMIDVSGLRREDGVIEATRVQRRDASVTASFQAPPLQDLLRRSLHIETVSLEGHLGQRLSHELVRIAGLRVDVGSLPVPQIPSGARVWVLADVSAAGQVRAKSVMRAPVATPIPSVPPIHTPVTPPPAPTRPGKPEPGSVQNTPPTGAPVPSLRVTDMPELLGPPGAKPAPPSDGVPTVVPLPPTPIEPVPIPPPPPVRIEPPLIDIIRDPTTIEIQQTDPRR